MNNINIVDKTLLKSAREETHLAIQLLGMVPRNLLPADPSDGSASLVWDDQLRMLTTQNVAGFKVAFEFSSQEIHVYKDSSIVKTLWLVGYSYEQMVEKLKQALTDLGLNGEKLNTNLPYELPKSVTQLGHPFRQQDATALTTLTSLYSITSELLERVFGVVTSASEIRCWPHHYDLATLVTIVEHEDPEEAKSIGFGFSPGDGGYDEPYFYITPWPYPSPDQLYEIGKPAFWNTEGWVGGVLKASDLNNTDAQSVITDFFEKGYHKLKEIL